MTPEEEQAAPEQNGLLNDTSGSVFDSLTRLACLGKQIVDQYREQSRVLRVWGRLSPGRRTVSRGVLGAESGANLHGWHRATGRTPHCERNRRCRVLAGLSSLRGLKSLITGGANSGTRRHDWRQSVGI